MHGVVATGHSVMGNYDKADQHYKAMDQFAEDAKDPDHLGNGAYHTTKVSILRPSSPSLSLSLSCVCVCLLPILMEGGLMHIYSIYRWLKLDITGILVVWSNMENSQLLLWQLLPPLLRRPPTY
eukprot:TRINITY_DN731_c0_g2_i1.p1 TRINITY_DN731_c0_g2~~TRINITY_DN731_c0_g2_i1.p1  ORF type:complete len:124 (+),score=7.56 TRINITY_DN731_c0_g2_i1:48-419(+)